jgi:hypothetical protein
LSRKSTILNAEKITMPDSQVRTIN